MANLKSVKGAPSVDQQTRTPAEEEAKQQFTPISSQEDFDKAVGYRLAQERAKYADYDELKKKAEAHDKVEDEKKTELEKLVEKLAIATAEAQTLKEATQAQTWRAEIRKEKNLPEDIDALLTGKTREDIEAQADILAKALGKSGKPVIKTDTGKSVEKTGENPWSDVLEQIKRR